MAALRNYFIILLCLSGCGKRAAEVQPEPVKQSFGKLLTDTNLTFEKNLKPVHPLSYGPNQKVTISSAEWLDLSHELMESENPALLQMGHKLAQGFYSFSSSHTQMTGTTNPPGNPYVEAALTYAKPVMEKKYDQAITHVESMIVDIADHMSISAQELGPDPAPGKLIEKVIIGLKMFEAQLLGARDGTGDSIIEEIGTSVDDKYVKDLQDLQRSASLDPEIPLSYSLLNLKNSLTKLQEISEFDRTRLLLQVQYAQDLAAKNEQMKSSDEALTFLVDFWLANDLRKKYPPSIKKVFENLSEAQIIALATENQPTLMDDLEWASIKEKQDSSSLSEREMASLYLSNNGFVLGPADWDKLKDDQKAKLDDLLINDKSVSQFANTIAVYPSDDIKLQRYALVVNWLGLSGRLAFPNELRSVFSTLTEEELNILAHNNSVMLLVPHPQLSAIRYKILSTLDDNRIASIKKTFNDTITSCTRTRVNKAIIPVAETFSSQIEGALIPALEKSRKDEGSLVTESYRDYGRYYLGKDIFGISTMAKGSQSSEASDNMVLKTHGLPLFESSQVHLNYRSGQWTNDDDGDFSSGAKVLGLGLLTLGTRLQSFVPYEGESSSIAAIDLGFEAINKMLAIAGYRDTSKQLINSLSVSMTSGHEGALIDIRNYDPTVDVFAVPDTIKISDLFKLAPSSRVSPKVSVEGQMQLLRGYSKMLGYFKPWNPSPFDVGLGAVTLDEDPTIKPFERGDYFLLSLALASSILKNIPAKMLGLMTSENQYRDGTKINDLSQVDASSAVITDYTRESLSSNVRTEGLALGILALSDFYEELKDIERSEEPAIVDALKKNPVETLRANIEKLISGFILFSTSHLMGEDGGFYSSYDLSKMEVGSLNRQLSDQLLMEEALLKASRTLKSGFMVTRVINNFFFLNHTLWDKDLGFYKLSENEKKPTVRLLHVARAMKNLTEVDELLTQSSNGMTMPSAVSRAQIKELLELWSSRFFNSEIMELSTIDQVQDFSL